MKKVAAHLTNMFLTYSFEIKGYKFDPGPSLFSEFQSRSLQANFPASVLDVLGKYVIIDELAKDVKEMREEERMARRGRPRRRRRRKPGMQHSR